MDNNAVETASFLLQCTSSLPNAEEISALLIGAGDENDDEMDEAGGKNDDGVEKVSDYSLPVSSGIQSPPLPPFIDAKQQSPLQIEVSCTTPRGKFLLQLHQNGIVLANPKKAEEQITIASSQVENVIWFRKEEEYKKLKQRQSSGKVNSKSLMVPGHMILICLNPSEETDGVKVIFRNKQMNQVCLQLPAYFIEGGSGEKEKECFTEKEWWDGLIKALCSDNVSMIRVLANMDKPSYTSHGDSFTFQSEGASGSSTTTEGMPYVGCYHGLNDGALYPLRDGLLFFKPPLFVHRSKLASISCGRGSGSASRYVDMAVELDSGDLIEFTNIYREELVVLNDYIHKVLIPAMQVDAEGGDSADEVVAEVIESDHPNSDGEEEAETSSTGKRRRSSRAASKSAREATRAHFDQVVDDSDEEDEEDFQSEDERGTDDSDSDAQINTDEEAALSSDDGEGMDTDQESEQGSASKKAKIN
ncbi:hypothetical protein HJC23_002104 [Cyclotella cryptica]|uniref:Histone chaperone RTT106/FACT complex subunit SPT16-like middle domain-containing protein n=1 Tax=Cyclotella cryptica TaxID=29204 RepID=A0ABD3PB06_9STRA